MEKSNTPKAKFSKTTRLISLALMFVGITGYFTPYVFVDMDHELKIIIRDISIAISSTALIAFLNDLYLKKEFQNVLKENVDFLSNKYTYYLEDCTKKIIDEFLSNNINKLSKDFENNIARITNDFENNLEEKIKKILDERLPLHIKHIRDLGLVDVYNNVNELNIIDQLKNPPIEAIIRIKSIWIPYLDELGRDAIAKAIIKRGCKFHFMIVDSELNEEVIGKRATSIGKTPHDAKYIKDRVQENFNNILLIFKQVYEINKDLAIDNIQLKLNSNFITLPLIAINDEIVFGMYLSGNPAYLGPHFKVVDNRKTLFVRIMEHWDFQWNHAGNREIDLQQSLDNDKVMKFK